MNEKIMSVSRGLRIENSCAAGGDVNASCGEIIAAKKKSNLGREVRPPIGWVDLAD